MRLSTSLLSASLLVWLTGCGTEPRVCAEALQALTVPLLNRTDHSLRDFQVTDTVRRTGAVLHLTPTTASALSAQEVGQVTIFTNALRDELSLAGDEVTVVVAADSHAVAGEFRLASDGCFVRRLAGPSTLVVR